TKGDRKVFGVPIRLEDDLKVTNECLSLRTLEFQKGVDLNERTLEVAGGNFQINGTILGANLVLIDCKVTASETACFKLSKPQAILLTHGASLDLRKVAFDLTEVEDSGPFQLIRFE